MSNATIEIIDFGEQLNHSDRDLDHQNRVFVPLLNDMASPII